MKTTKFSGKIVLSDYKELGFDSQEEYMVFLYFEELKSAGLVDTIEIQPTPFILYTGLKKKLFSVKKLKTKVKRQYTKRTHLLNPHIYTTDLKIKWTRPVITRETKFFAVLNSSEIDKNKPFIVNTFIGATEKQGYYSYIEVKPKFDRNNMTRIFTQRTQPWVHQLFGIYVQLIKPIDLFKKTFIPKVLLPYMYYQKNTRQNRKGDKKYLWEYKSLKQYLDG